LAEKVLMLALSPTMEAGVITKWHKKVGEKVSEGDLLCDVETDKAVMSYEASQGGYLLGMVCEEGEGAAVGATIALMGVEGEDVSALLSEAKAEKASGAGGKTGPSGSDGSPSTVVDAPAETSASKEPMASSSEADTLPPGGRKRSSPLARTLASRNGLEVDRIPGSGPGGRVVKRDVEQAMAQSIAGTPAGTGMIGPAPGAAGLVTGTTARGTATASGTVVTPLSGTSMPAPSGTDEVIPLSGKRRIIAKRLAESMYTAPHYYLKKTVRMDALIVARKALAAKGEKRSFNAFLIKFVAEALRRHPQVNASWQGDSILRFGHADVGLAVAQPDGLITPVVRDCWHKGIRQIDGELAVLIGKAQQGTLRPEEYSDATFTISNLGSFGIEEFTAIINPPGSAILAVGEIARVQRIDENDKPEVISAMTLTLSCDHRVIDGAVGAAFLKDLVDMMEDPIRVLL